MIRLLSIITLFLACTKDMPCKVTDIRTIREYKIDSTYVEREYLITLECDD